jgi:plasmid stability protein
VVTNEQRQRLEAMLKSEPEPEAVHVSINLDDLTMAEKRKILRR